LHLVLLSQKCHFSLFSNNGVLAESHAEADVMHQVLLASWLLIRTMPGKLTNPLAFSVVCDFAHA